MSFQHPDKQKQLAEFVEIQNPHVLTGGGEAPAFALYKAGAVMKVRTGAMRITEWRLVQPDAGTVHLWQGDDKPGRAFNLYGTDEMGVDINERLWRFSQEKFDEAVKRWETALWCAQDFNKTAGAREPDLSKLSEKDLDFARELKAKGILPMVACYSEHAKILCAMGFAKVHPEGLIYANTELRHSSLPEPIPAEEPADVLIG